MALRPLPLVLALLGSLSMRAADRLQEPVVDNGLLTQVRTISRFDEAPQVNRLVGWTEDGPRLQKGQVAPDWVQMSFPLSIPPVSQSEARGWVLELADGLRLKGQPQTGSADRVDWAIGGGSNLVLIPVDLLMLKGFGRTRVPIALGDQEEDLLVLRTSAGLDRRSGWLEGIDEEGITFAVGDRVESHAWDKVEGVRL
ncbi:MAG: hypothetical protein MK209_05345, partial [Planctomycetes bacterium]|nr:hypothetical protein [Planctomycetota bacterium]